jgi:hypothetical protein
MMIMRSVALIRIAVCLAALLSFSACRQAPDQVLILGTVDDPSKSYGIEAFDRALANGGQVEITVDDIRNKYPKFESTYTIVDREGKFFIQGAVINFVVDHGWRFHSRDFGGLVFTRR